jgi:hypothetical protein
MAESERPIAGMPPIGPGKVSLNRLRVSSPQIASVGDIPQPFADKFQRASCVDDSADVSLQGSLGFGTVGRDGAVPALPIPGRGGIGRFRNRAVEGARRSGSARLRGHPLPL